MKPFAPLARIVAGSNHHQLIHRILRPDLPRDTHRIDLITTSHRRVSIIDSGITPESAVAEGDTAIHVLWQLNEVDAAIWLDGAMHAVAPGDTVMVPGGDSWYLSPDTLALVIAVRTRTLALPIQPTHGTEQFHDYNRETRYPGSEAIGLARWKITQPLPIDATNAEQILVSLYGDIALQHASGVEMLHVGTASVIRGEQITLVPNGLSYVLAID